MPFPLNDERMVRSMIEDEEKVEKLIHSSKGRLPSKGR